MMTAYNNVLPQSYIQMIYRFVNLTESDTTVVLLTGLLKDTFKAYYERNTIIITHMTIQVRTGGYYGLSNVRNDDCLLIVTHGFEISSSCV